jgi:2-hydroxychromene-2-carboxylate isomerase
VSLARRLAPHATAALTSPRTRALRRSAAELARRARGAAREVHYFHQVDDPYGQLAAQRLGELAARYEIALIPHLVGPPSDAAAPERALLEAFARRDAADIAPGYGLAFDGAAQAPDPALALLAQRVLASAIARGAFATQAAQVGSALFAGDRRALEALAAAAGATSEADARAACAAGSALRERLGHYLGAMFHYGGEWYWGIDRLHHLERRLGEAGARRAGEPATLIAPRPAPRGGAMAGASGAGVSLELFASLRSPYTYVATERVLALAKHYGVALALRPVLPMVMRGLPVPPAKRRYIALDTKREAEDAGVAFGRVCDPVGRPVERCFSLYPFARERGRAAELLLEFMRASWSQGVDTGTDAGLRLVAERAGLEWREARAHLDRDAGWRAELEANRQALFALGLWGVPSFCVRGGGAAPYSTWGQDRLWRVEEEIRARLHAGGLTPAALGCGARVESQNASATSGSPISAPYLPGASTGSGFQAHNSSTAAACFASRKPSTTGIQRR